MSQWLKQSTAVTIKLGPFLDKTDGVTEETGLSPSVEVSKNNADFVARSSASAISHNSNGWYSVPLDTTDTGTLGPLCVKSDDAANHLPVWKDFMVVPAVVYDSLIAGSDLLTVDATDIADTLLNRDMSAVSDTNARSPLNALRLLRNKWSVAAGTLTVTKENDTTSAWTSAVTGTAGADPITSSDPA